MYRLFAERKIDFSIKFILHFSGEHTKLTCHSEMFIFMSVKECNKNKFRAYEIEITHLKNRSKPEFKIFDVGTGL